MPPKLNRRRAEAVLSRIDAILAWEAQHENERDTRFVELGKCLCEVRAGQYWRLENLKSFDDFLERRFPESKTESLLPDVDPRAAAAAGEKRTEGGRLDKGNGVGETGPQAGRAFESATWLHKARTMPKEEFKREVEKELTGKDSEPAELIYFKVYKSQIPVIERAIETAGTDAGLGQVPRLLPGDDLRGLPGGRLRSKATTRRYCCSRCPAITNCCPRLSKRPSFPKSAVGLREQFAPEEAASST